MAKNTWDPGLILIQACLVSYNGPGACRRESKRNQQPFFASDLLDAEKKKGFLVLPLDRLRDRYKEKMRNLVTGTVTKKMI